MVKAKAKTINILLDEGTLDGVICMVASSWSSGELYSAPRESAEKIITSDACKKYGVYLLLSDNQAYVGQSSDLANRIKQHIIGKEWWNQVVVLTTADDSFDRTDIDFLESSLIQKVLDNEFIKCDNKNKGNPQKVDRFKRVSLDQYMEEALFLMELIGINIFSNKEKQKTKGNLLSAVANPSDEQIEIRAKREAKAFLEDNGYHFSNSWNYGKLQETNNCFWLNPKADLLNSNWDIVLNNQLENTLILLNIPRNSISVGKEKAGGNLIVRSDKPDLIDLKIDKETLVDKTSGFDFKKYVVKKYSY